MNFSKNKLKLSFKKDKKKGIGSSNCKSKVLQNMTLNRMEIYSHNP